MTTPAQPDLSHGDRAIEDSDHHANPDTRSRLRRWVVAILTVAVAAPLTALAVVGIAHGIEYMAADVVGHLF